MPEVLVIGGGVIGASVAFRAAQAGASVTVLDSGGMGSGASMVGYGMTFASNKNDQEYYELNVAGMSEHIRLGHELGHAPWLHQVGSIQWDQGLQSRDYVGNEDPLMERAARLRTWGYKAESLPISELRHLEPDVVAPANVEDFVYFADEGYVDPVLYVGALLGRARDMGATIMPNSSVTAVIREGEKVIGVETSNGETLHADTVISCAGSWTDVVARMAGIEIPMSPWIGVTMVTTPTAARLHAVVRDEGFASLRPDGAGRVMLHHNDFDELVDPNNPNDPTDQVKSALLTRAATMLPQLQYAQIETARIAIRPVPGGNHNSIIGATPGVEGLYVVATHSAINLAAIMGRLAAEEVLKGSRNPRLAAFRPERIMGGV